MPDVIRLLSDHLANQIAAGEVIQRPASAVKEMLENAVDAGATDVQLIVADAGKELVQVVDNGGGMSPTDARMAFERHATSKIGSIEDLFRIRTMGFRGEALASIAAVAQVELKTRRAEDAVGTRLVIEGTEIKAQEACATAAGTSLAVKNLFFNVPARRHFLKSNTTETRHIIDEFTRVAMPKPDVAFRFYHNGAEQMRLGRGTSKERIVDLLGTTYERNLAPVEEESDVLTIRGFIGKPEAATKTRGQQFFFVNGRFVRSPYLHHAVTAAYEGLIPKDAFPFYVLYLDIDPARVDVNVHPTKQEVKFEDDRLLYAYLHAAVKHALARHNIAPSIDFTLAPSVQGLPAVALPATDADAARTSGGYLAQTFSGGGQAHLLDRTDALRRWKDFYASAETRARQGFEAPAPEGGLQPEQHGNTRFDSPEESDTSTLGHPGSAAATAPLLVQGLFLVSTVKSGLVVVQVRRAQERILFERMIAEYNGGGASSQRLLFPVSVEIPPHDALLLQESLPELSRVGFDVSPMGGGTFAVGGVPAGLPPGEELGVLEEVVDGLRHERGDAVSTRPERLIARLAHRLSRGVLGTLTGVDAQRAIIDELFACGQPEYTPGGKRVYRLVGREELEELLG